MVVAGVLQGGLEILGLVGVHVSMYYMVRYMTGTTHHYLLIIS